MLKRIAAFPKEKKITVDAKTGKKYYYCTAGISDSHPHRHTAYILYHGDVFRPNRNYSAYGSGICPRGSVSGMGPDMVRHTLCT